jgi:hypothetical protein
VLQDGLACIILLLSRFHLVYGAMARMKSTPVQSETPKSIEAEGVTSSKCGEDEFLKILDSDELEMIDSIAKPPPVRDLHYFVGIGLSNDGENPHRLKEHKHIPTLEIEKVFGKWSNRTSYYYKECRDAALREKIEKIWKLAYSKEKMPRSKIVATQFALGIVAEQMGKKISWAAFAEETNATQHAKYQSRIKSALVGGFRDKKAGGSAWKVKTEQGSDCELESKLTHHGSDMGTSAAFSGRSTEWRQKLSGEVNQLLQLCSIELEAAKQQLQGARKEKQVLVDRVAANRIFMESVQASLLEEVCKTKELESSEKRASSLNRSPVPSPSK